MVAALSWAARLKNGLARTREVLNTPVSELFVRRRVDESLFEDLETALLQADCGVAATDWLLTSLREKARKERIEDAEVLKRALTDSVTELLRPLEQSRRCQSGHPWIVDPRVPRFKAISVRGLHAKTQNGLARSCFRDHPRLPADDVSSQPRVRSRASS
jgi:hypothetical protein